jgi:hypothetical protein
VAETSGGMVKASAQWTPEQYQWLQDESERLGVGSVSAVARMVVQAAMTAAQEECTHECRIHPRHEGAPR